MADRNLVLELKRWATEEFNIPSDSLLCVGTGKSIWKYMIQHVFHQRFVYLILSLLCLGVLFTLTGLLLFTGK
uniref:Uncharacterized protein n=1 Tax=Periophthalmus magnuspinnatus TaxID=409849 RepID=A0A3B3ZTJ7_9GOBI